MYDNFYVTICIFICALHFIHNRGEWWITAIGFSVIIFVYDEMRKLIIRRFPTGEAKLYIVFKK